MGLFVNKPQFNDQKPLFTLSMNKTVLIIGLGNTGKEFEGTRHNLGFDCVDNFVVSRSEFGGWQEKKNFKAHFTIGQFGENRVIVIKPTTFMNLSGEAVLATSDFYKIPASQMLVVHDELDINFGVIKLANSGSSAGHNGIKSVIEVMGENFNRVRIGIGPKTPAQIDSADFVLQKLNKKEQAELPTLYKEVSSILIEYVYSNQINNETRTFLL